MRLPLLQTPATNLRVPRATLTSDQVTTNLKIPSGLIIATMIHRAQESVILIILVLQQRGFKSEPVKGKTHRSGSQRISNSKLPMSSPYRNRLYYPPRTWICYDMHSIFPMRDALLSLGVQNFYWAFIM